MARRRGFFAELNHQSQLAAKRQEQANRQAYRDYETALREAERASRRSE
jgi:restriction system protein